LARLAGIDLPKNKKAFIGLTYIFGIGRTTSFKILNQAEIDPDKKVNELTEEEIAKIREIITTEIKVEGALRSEVNQNIKRLMDIGSYRGLRHRRGLPARGQRTRTNSRTRKGKRRTVAGKKKAPGKK
jgi:small subunit ribosomal protein S13